MVCILKVVGGEWWIVRRNREQHPLAERETWLALTPSIMYHFPANSFSEYAMLRVKDMLIRDEKGYYNNRK